MTDPVDPPASGGGEGNDAPDIESAHALIKKLREEIKQIKADKTPQDAKDAKTIASLKRQIDELQPLADKARDLEDADKSELEKLTAKVAESERKAQEAESRAMRAEVAASKGLTPAQAKRLVGSSLEELEADADELLDSFKPQEGNGGQEPHEGKPRENLRGGTDPTQEPDLDLKSLVDSIPPT